MADALGLSVADSGSNENMALDSSNCSNVVTLEPYSLSPPRPLPQRNGRTNKVIKNVSGKEIFPGVFENPSYDFGRNRQTPK